ncbi:syntaxin binding protein, partial [Trypanosoma cruzi]
MPRPVRLRLFLLLVAASSTDELTEAKKQQPIRDGGLTPDAHLSANLEHVMRRAGSVQRYSTASAQSERSTGASASNAATDGYPFLKQACMLMETADRNRTLRVGLSLASMEGDHVIGPNGASGGQKQWRSRKKRRAISRVWWQMGESSCSGWRWRCWDDCPHNSSAHCAACLVVWPAARGARSMRYPKGMAVRWSVGNLA